MGLLSRPRGDCSAPSCAASSLGAVNWVRWERYAPLTGIAAVVLWVIGVWLVFGPGNLVSSDSTPDEILNNYSGDARTLQIGGWLVQLGAVAFLWFAGSLRATL